MPDYRAHIGRRIRQARESQGLTQCELAKRLGISYQLLQQHEVGQKLNLDRMIAIAETLRVDFYALISGQAASPSRRGRKVLELAGALASAASAIAV